jgi:uncharacterized protein YlxP (DUF503 family)
MIVGSLRVRLLLREARTLKDKRQVIRSIKDRLRNAFNISIAEVDAEDNRQIGILGMAMVCNESGPIRHTFEEIVQALRAHPIAELLDHEIDVW